ncbi:MAG TPA: amidohydrolase family protein [Candidatus Polarisedimenticolaceae bacterium]|nr:amidohydrolase family protein [Candidatus Polarisedimenticolaceae bacterium]
MKRRFKFFVSAAVLFLLLASALFIRAQQINRPLVIEGARLIDGTGRPPIENAVIVIADDKIQQVFQKGARAYPQDARIIHAEGKTVIPALFDIDTHIGQQGLEAAAQALSNYLYFGIVNISDTGVTLIHGEGLKKLEREDKLVAPRIFEAGPTFTVVGGHPIPTNRALGRAIDPRTLTQIDGPQAAVEEVRKYRSEYKVATIKTIMESGGVLGYPRMSVETLKALADEAHKHRLKVYAHAIQLADIRDSLNGGVDLVAHGLVEALTPESDIAQLMAKNKVSWLPDLNNSEAAIKLFDHAEIFNDPQVRKSVPGRYIDMARDPKVLASMRPRLEGSRVRFESSRKTVKVLYDLGVNILVGTDSTGAPHRMFFGWDLHREMELLVEAGMKPMDVIIAASRKAAEYLGQDNALGTVEPGKMADLIILSQNPLEDIRNTRRIEQVIYAGRIIDRDNIPMLDPFKEGIVVTGRASQQVVDLKVDQTLAGQFPPAPAKEMVLQRCSTCHSLKVLLDKTRTEKEWEIATFGMLGGRDQDGETIVKYLTAHFGK